MVVNVRAARRGLIMCALALALASVESTSVGWIGVAAGDSDQSFSIGYGGAIGRPVGGGSYKVQTLGYGYRLVESGASPIQACGVLWTAQQVYPEDRILHPGPVPHSRSDYMNGCREGLASLGITSHVVTRNC